MNTVLVPTKALADPGELDRALAASLGGAPDLPAPAPGPALLAALLPNGAGTEQGSGHRNGAAILPPDLSTAPPSHASSLATQPSAR